jgi:HEAT repeat protein
MSMRNSPGIPFPRLGRWFVAAALACVAWLQWSEFQRPRDPVGPGEPSLTILQSMEELARRGSEGVAELRASLSSRDPRARAFAAFSLGQIGPDAAEALPQLQQCLADKEADVRVFAISALCRIERDDGRTSAALVTLLHDAESRVRDEAAHWLVELSPASLEPLVDSLAMEAPAMRCAMLRVLREAGRRDRRAHSGKVGGALRGQLADADAQVRREALTALAEWRLARPAELRELLLSSELGRIEVALRAVADLGPEAEELLPEVVALIDQLRLDSVPLTDGISRQLSLVLFVLSSMQTAARPAAPRLLALLPVRRDATRSAIASTLVAIGTDEATLIPVLRELLLDSGSDSDRDVVWQAGRLLVQVSPDAARREVARLALRLQNGDSVDEGMLFALHALAPEAGEAVASLAGLLSNGDPKVSHRAVLTLTAIGADAAPAVPALVKQLHRPSATWQMQICAAEALGAVGPAAGSAVPELLAALAGAEPAQDDRDRPEIRFRVAAVTSLGRIGDGRPAVISRLRSTLASQWPGLRVAALRALADLDASSPELLAAVVRRLRVDADAGVRMECLMAVSRFSGDRSEALPALVEVLDDENFRLRTQAALCLGSIGADARPVLPALREVLMELESPGEPSLVGPHVSWAGPFGLPSRASGSPQWALREAVRNAISLIEPEAEEIDDPAPEAAAGRDR